MEEQAKKMKRYHNHSLMALASNSQGEATKKSIEADDTGSFGPIAMSNNRKFLFSLPFTTEVDIIVKAFSQRFAGFLLHSQYDRKSAVLILEGIKMGGLLQSFKNVLDYLVFCCSRGMKFGLLQESYNVVVITIKRDVIEDRCLILVANPYPKKYLTRLHDQILEPIQQELKVLGKQLQVPSESKNHFKNNLSEKNACLQVQMRLCRKIYNLFVYQEHKQFEKYKLLLRHSIQIIQGQRERYQKKMGGSLTKHSRPNPSGLVDVFVLQSQNLLACLHNSCKQEGHDESYLHSLLASECMQQIALYKIEQVLCLYELPVVKEIYLKYSQEQSLAFNRNVEMLNAEFTDEDCFQHLQLKMKYRLTSERIPYKCGIEELRKIRYCISLREMLLTIQECFSKVKSDCLMAHGGHVELASMDDLLPVMIFVTVRAAIPNFPAIVKMVDDYARFKNVFELEERILTTLQVAIEDISRKWIKKEKQAEILREN